MDIVRSTPLSGLGIVNEDLSIDAFNRLRTSETGQRFDVEFIYDEQDEIVDVIETGAGTVTHNANSRDLTLKNVATTTGDKAEVLSYDIPYTPGNSQAIAITGTLDAADIGGGNAEVFLRSKVTGSVQEEVYTQAQWDGTGHEDADWATSQILEIDFQSLKVGAIRFFLNRGGELVWLHTITNDNKRVGGYWQLPSLPVGWRIYNDATYTYMEMVYGDDENGVGLRYKIAKNASAEMRGICATVKSEGGLHLKDLPGYPRAIDNGVTAKTVSTTEIPILSIRPKTTFKGFNNRGLTILKDFTLETNNPIRIRVYHGATLTGASWADVDTNNSMMEYDITASAFSGGHSSFTDFIGTGKNTSRSINNLLARIVLWSRRNSFNGIITFTAVRTGTTNADVNIASRWEEIR